MNKFREHELVEVAYPEWLTNAAGVALPGATISVVQGMVSSIQISGESASRFWTSGEYGNLHCGPFGAVALLVRRSELKSSLKALREKYPLAGSLVASTQRPRSVVQDAAIVRELGELTGRVVGLGWNRVNEPGFDPTAHGEVTALRHAGAAVNVPWGWWKEKDLAVLLCSSCEGCDMCKAAATLWGCVYGFFLAAIGNDARNFPGFSETTTGVDADADRVTPAIHWGGRFGDPDEPVAFGHFAHLREDARNAMRRYQGRPYQS